MDAKEIMDKVANNYHC